MARIETDVVVVGTGPGGATIAKELACKGQNVVIVEKGRWHKLLVGRYASFGSITKISRPKGGGVMFRGVTVGGTSMIFNGTAYDPPTWLNKELGIDLSEETADTKTELNVKTLPEDFYKQWPATRRLMEAAADLNIALMPQYKFVDSNRCDPSCDNCMLGCRQNAKWTAREYVTQALRRGANLLDRTSVNELIIDKGKALGVRIKGPNRIDEVRANKVVLAAGGMNTPVILLKSGIPRAGEGFFNDPMNILWGLSKYPGPVNEQTFSIASEEFVESDGYMIGNLGSTGMFLNALIGGLRLDKYRHIIGMFTKIEDSPGGRILENGRIEKTYTKEDMIKFDKSTETCRKIMIKAGADSNSIRVVHNIAGHPGGTAAIGRVVDKNLKAYEIENLYVCDSSVLPHSTGKPPSLTIIALAKYLAKTI